MPVPTPPKVNPLEKKTPDTKKPGRPSPRVPGRPSKSTQKISKDIQDLATTLDENSTDIPEDKPKETPPKAKTPFKPAEHLTQSPFRDNEAMRDLQRNLKKTGDPKQPIKRSPRRKPTNATGEN